MSNPDLFSVPPSPIPELEQARQRLARAQAEYDRENMAGDDTPESIPPEVWNELARARRFLAAAEAREMHRRGSA